MIYRYESDFIRRCRMKGHRVEKGPAFNIREFVDSVGSRFPKMIICLTMILMAVLVSGVARR